MNQKIVKFYLAQILLALQDLHSRNIVYRGLSLDRVLIDRQGHVKLCNYGFYSTFFWKEGKRFAMITDQEISLSPQEIKGEEVGTFTDLWAFGVIAYQLLSGERDFNTREYLTAEQDEYLRFQKKVSKNAKMLVETLLQEQPQIRLGAGEKGLQEIKEHAFFNRKNWSIMREKQQRGPLKLEGSPFWRKLSFK